MRFPVTIHVRVPAEYVLEWWMDYSPADASISSSILQRQVTANEDGSLHLLTLGSHDRHTTRTDATVRRTGPWSFRQEGEMEIDGAPAAFVTTEFSVHADDDGTLVTAEFEFRPKTWKYRFLFPFATARFRHERETAYREFGRALSAQYSRGEPARAESPR